MSEKGSDRRRFGPYESVWGIKSSPYLYLRRTFFNNFNYSIPFKVILQAKFSFLLFLSKMTFFD